jgi:hypothetical protein
MWRLFYEALILKSYGKHVLIQAILLIFNSIVYFSPSPNPQDIKAFWAIANYKVLRLRVKETFYDNGRCSESDNNPKRA